MKAHSKAVARAVFVTFLWSTSWVLIRFGLQSIPPLTFAALRYGMATIVLWLFIALRGRGSSTLFLPARQWPRLILLGIVYYTITQASQFIALSHLRPTTLSLLLSFSTVITAIISRISIHERTLLRQWAGVVLYVGATIVFLLPNIEGQWSLVGYTAAGIGVLANAAAGVLGRSINRTKQLTSITVTVISMSVGSAVLIVAAAITDGLPSLGLREWGILLWLSIINTAFAFVMWNQAHQELQAVQSSVINSTMLFQISLLAFIFLGERLLPLQWLMIAVGGLATLTVQLASAAPSRRFISQRGDKLS